MIKNILCATDGSLHGDKGVVYAAELAAKLGADLTICTVNELQGGLRGPHIYMHTSGEIKDMLIKARALAKDHGAQNITEIELDAREIPEAVATYAKDKQFDHIVTGTGDKHGLKKLLLGSVASKIASSAHCNVTIAR